MAQQSREGGSCLLLRKVNGFINTRSNIKEYKINFFIVPTRQDWK